MSESDDTAMPEFAPAVAESTANGDVLKLLNERFAVFREAKPLAIGIHKEIMKAVPGLDAGKMRTAMRRHTGTTRYLRAIATGSERHDLNGAVVGTISEEQKKQAGDALRERFKKGADQRRAEKQVQQEKERVAAREKEKQAKLLALAQKFNKR